jgi:RND family efflux transporter MFP subunit
VSERIRMRAWRARPAKWMFLPPVAIGASILIVAAALGPGATRDDVAVRPVPVRAITVEQTTVFPVLTGYGEARPLRTWQAVAPLPGRIATLHPDLHDGAQFTAGTVLATIDPTDYTLALKRAESIRAQARARLDELGLRTTDLTHSIDIESSALAIAEREFERRRTLAAAGHISRLEADAEEQRLLRQRQNLQSLRSQANLVPTQRAAQQAQLEEAEALVAKAREDLSRTEIVMPFTGRIDRLQIEATQYVASGQPMFTASTTDAVEVVVRVPPEQLWSRFPDVLERSAGPGTFDLSAEVVYEAGDVRLVWPGSVVRIDPALDPQTRTAQVYVRVDNVDYDLLVSGHLFVDVRVTGPALHNRIVVPRLAYREGRVYVIDTDSKLRRRSLDIAFRQDDIIVVARGLVAGDVLVTSELPFPVDGLAVLRVDDRDNVTATDSVSDTVGMRR